MRNFFADHFSSWDDARAALMIIKTFVFVDDVSFKETGVRLESSEICEIVKRMFRNHDCRTILVNAMTKFMDGSNEQFCTAYQIIQGEPKMIESSESIESKFSLESNFC